MCAFGKGGNGGGAGGNGAEGTEGARAMGMIAGMARGLSILLLAGAGVAAQTAPPLRLEINTAKLEFRYEQPIKFTVRMSNTSASPVRIMKPGVDYAQSNAVVAFRIERADGVVAERRGQCLGQFVLGSPESRSIELAPGEGYQTTLDLFGDSYATSSRNPGDGSTLASCWSYYFGKQYNAYLRPGQYHVSLSYTIPATGQPRGWSDDLAAKFGQLWRGQITSNVLAITVK